MHNLSSIYEDTKIIKTAKPSITGVKRDNVPLAGVSEGTESPNKVVKRRSSLYGWSGLTNTQAGKHDGDQSKTPSVSSCGIIPQGSSVCEAYKGTLSRAERPLTEAVPSVSYADISPPRGESPLQKQSTGLFLNSPLAGRFVVCGALPHTPQGLSALDLTKGLSTLWNPGVRIAAVFF